MGVSDRYINTEIGLFPIDWRIMPFDSIGEVRGRVGWKGYTKMDLRSFGPYTIGAKHIDQNCKLDLSDATHLSLEKYLQSPEIFVRKDDVLIVQRGTIGKIVMIEEDIGNATINPSMLIMRMKEASPKFVYYYFISKSGQDQILMDTSSTGVPMITQKQVKNFKIPLPPLPEQKAIAEVLSDTDNLIKTLEKQIEKKRLIKQGAMQKLLSPKGDWQEGTIEEIADVLDNLRIPLNEEQRNKMKGHIPYCGANGVMDYVNDFVIDDDIILMAEDGGYFDEYKTRPIAYRMKGKCWVNNHAHILKATDTIDQDFLFYSLVHKNILENISSGTRSKLNKGELLKIIIQFPSSKVQQRRISEVLIDADNLIDGLNLKLIKYRTIKQGLMQNLLTGKIRLKQGMKDVT